MLYAVLAPCLFCLLASRASGMEEEGIYARFQKGQATRPGSDTPVLPLFSPSPQLPPLRLRPRSRASAPLTSAGPNWREGLQGKDTFARSRQGQMVETAGSDTPLLSLSSSPSSSLSSPPTQVQRLPLGSQSRAFGRLTSADQNWRDAAGELSALEKERLTLMGHQLRGRTNEHVHMFKGRGSYYRPPTASSFTRGGSLILSQGLKRF